MVKNTGIPGNQLSDLDFGGVLKDAHHKLLHALDVHSVNSQVPSPGIAIEVTRDSANCDRISSVEYKGYGLNEIQDVLISNNPQGKAEVTTFSFIGISAVSLSATYATISDDVGSVGMLFRLDGGSTGTSGAARDIIIDIATGDSATQLGQKAADTMGADSKFTGVNVSGLCQLTSSTVGNKTNATSGDSGLASPLISAGYDNLQGKLFYVNKYDDSGRYAYYYTINGAGSPPSYTGISITAIDIAATDGTGQVATKSAAVITLNAFFTASATDSVFTIVFRGNGDTTGFEDVDTGFSATVTQAGQAQETIVVVVVTYGDCGSVTGIEYV
jgi:hypothetical protein